jgi:hypothetical protein
MKKVKLLGLGVAMALTLAITSGHTVVQAATGRTIVVNEGETSLSSAVESAQSGDTIQINGTVKSGTVNVPEGVNIVGGTNAVIDFSLTKFGQKGLNVLHNGSTIQNLEICNAGDNGIFVQGSSNVFYGIYVHNNKDAGVQVSNGGANNYFGYVYSYYNSDPKGENADGFAIKLHSGEGNVLEDCVAAGNSDDGYDLYAAHGAVTFNRCKAINNGECDGIRGDGNGFKVGGIDNKTPGVAAHPDPLNHILTDCEASGNTRNGFDRNNQTGVVTMLRCTANANGGANYSFPQAGTPSALGYKVIFGRAIIQDCISENNANNNISGADLYGDCTGF